MSVLPPPPPPKSLIFSDEATRAIDNYSKESFGARKLPVHISGRSWPVLVFWNTDINIYVKGLCERVAAEAAFETKHGWVFIMALPERWGGYTRTGERNKVGIEMYFPESNTRAKVSFWPEWLGPGTAADVRDGSKAVEFRRLPWASNCSL